jgi:hypothetical protein
VTEAQDEYFAEKSLLPGRHNGSAWRRDERGGVLVAISSTDKNRWPELTLWSHVRVLRDSAGYCCLLMNLPSDRRELA